MAKSGSADLPLFRDAPEAAPARRSPSRILVRPDRLTGPFGGDTVLVGGIAPENLAAILLGEWDDLAGIVHDSIEAVHEEALDVGSVTNDLGLRGLQPRPTRGFQEERLRT